MYICHAPKTRAREVRPRQIIVLGEWLSPGQREVPTHVLPDLGF